MNYAVLKCLAQSKYLTETFAMFYTQIIRHHIVLEQWKKSLACMLEKGKGPLLNKLRIIQLIQADLQMLMRVLILPSANKVIEEGIINKCQYARRKETMMNALVEKRLIIESSILTRKDPVWLVSDMSACYNRHIKELGQFMLESHRVNADGAETLMKVIVEMETQVQTSFGRSKNSHKTTEDITLYGTGQGNIVSVFVCQFGTSVIFYILEDTFKGWDIEDENGNVVEVRLVVGFVNDTDFFVSRDGDFIQVAGKIYKHYIQLYQATGGLITIEKSKFYHWKWVVRGGKIMVEDMMTTSPEIQLEQLLSRKGSTFFVARLNLKGVTRICTIAIASTECYEGRRGNVH